jgi:glycine hydroxymethyltransferase
MNKYTPRTWIPPQIEAFIQEHAARYQAMALNEIDSELQRLIGMHEQYMDHQCITLYAGTNIVNPRVRALLGSTIGSRANLGYPGDKYNKGMQYAEQIEIMLAELLKKLFNAAYSEIRVGSGSLANLYAYMATTRPGDRIMAFSDAAAGHVTHHREGAAGLYGLEIYDVPFDVDRMDIDEVELATQARTIQPKLIIVAGSMCLFPYSLAAVRRIADEVGAYVMYDAAHMGGLIAGGQFQQPLAEGADLMTGSTYKSFGGPPSGILLTNSATLAERLERIAYPGLTANFDLSRSAAMVVAVLDLLEHGQAYAKMCIANAQALATALAEQGVTVHKVADRGYTQSQHVAIQALAYNGGNRASKLLEQANILMSGIGLPIAPVPGDYNAIRIGTQEITRWGMEPQHMPIVAEFIARVLVHNEPPAQVRPEVIAFREAFQKIHYVRGS